MHLIPAHKPTTEAAEFLELPKTKSAKANNDNPAHTKNAIDEKTERNPLMIQDLRGGTASLRPPGRRLSELVDQLVERLDSRRQTPPVDQDIAGCKE
jgi:hypothetical protein